MLLQCQNYRHQNWADYKLADTLLSVDGSFFFGCSWPFCIRVLFGMKPMNMFRSLKFLLSNVPSWWRWSYRHLKTWERLVCIYIHFFFNTHYLPNICLKSLKKFNGNISELILSTFEIYNNLDLKKDRAWCVYRLQMDWKSNYKWYPYYKNTKPYRHRWEIF